MTARRTWYSLNADGSISRNGKQGTEWVEYIRFCGDRAEAILWTDRSADAARGFDVRAVRAVRGFAHRRVVA